MVALTLSTVLHCFLSCSPVPALSSLRLQAWRQIFVSRCCHPLALTVSVSCCPVLHYPKDYLFSHEPFVTPALWIFISGSICFISTPDTLSSGNVRGKHFQRLIARPHFVRVRPHGSHPRKCCSLYSALRLCYVSSRPSQLQREQLVSQSMPKFNPTPRGKE